MQTSDPELRHAIRRAEDVAAAIRKAWAPFQKALDDVRAGVAQLETTLRAIAEPRLPLEGLGGPLPSPMPAIPDLRLEVSTETVNGILDSIARQALEQGPGRNMSFAMTADQVLAQTKTVTRRVGWAFLEVGDVLQPVRKAQGLRKGEKAEKLGPPIQVTEIRLEPLYRIKRYGADELEAEGGIWENAEAFVEAVCKANRGVTPSTKVRRIAFRYLRAPDFADLAQQGYKITLPLGKPVQVSRP